MDRAYSLLNVKGVTEAPNEWVITGVASTPTTDRMGDQVDPLGAKFKTPMPLLWQHDSQQPVGRVEFAKPTKTGIPFVAHLPKVAEAGVLKDRIDEAVQSIKYRLVSAVSIGFRALEDGVEQIKGTGGLLFKAWEWLELSLVTIPANPEAVLTGGSITGNKSFDSDLRAALGKKQIESPPPGASGTKQPASGGLSFSRSPKGNEMKTLQQLREEREIKADRMKELAELFQADGHDTTDEEADEFDTLETEVKSLDTDIRVARFNATNAASARPVDGKSGDSARASRSPNIIVRSTDIDDKFKGQGFVRLLLAKAASYQAGRNGDRLTASEYVAKRWGRTNPQLVALAKANEVAGGGTGSGEWGAELIGIDNRYTGDFVNFLYAMTVYDRLGLRPAPKNVSVKGQDGAAIGYWVGESKAIPVSKPDFSTVDLTTLKAAGICIASKELIADSDPAAEQLIRDSLAEAISQRIDTTFLSATAASAGVSPAGILNGVSALHTSGTDEAAVRSMIKALYSTFITDKNSSGLKLAMAPGMAKAIGLIVNALGQTSFPGLGTTGGVLLGDTVITGDNVDPSTVLLIKPSDIWMIGDEGLQVSMSDSAMVEQNSAPLGATDTPTAASVTLTSMFQEDSVAIKVVRRTSFKKRRTNAVTYVDDADFDGTVS